MPMQQLSTPYPLIDADPHAGRVLRYMRPSDYAYIAGGAAVAPGLLYGWEYADPTRAIKRHLRPALKLATVIGLFGGFLAAYQRSSLRFLGWTENKREQEKDFAELSQLARAGKPLYGETTETVYNQGAAFRNSVFSSLRLSTLPWFNLAVHPYHGVDASKYGGQTESQDAKDSK